MNRSSFDFVGRGGRRGPPFQTTSYSGVLVMGFFIEATIDSLNSTFKPLGYEWKTTSRFFWLEFYKPGLIQMMPVPPGASSPPAQTLNQIPAGSSQNLIPQGQTQSMLAPPTQGMPPAQPNAQLPRSTANPTLPIPQQSTLQPPPQQWSAPAQPPPAYPVQSQTRPNPVQQTLPSPQPTSYPSSQQPVPLNNGAPARKFGKP